MTATHHRSPLLLGSVLLGGVLSAAALATPQEEAPAKAAPAVTAPKPALTGTVLFEGERPSVKPLKVPAQQAKGCCPDGELVDPTDFALQISEAGGISGCVVTVKVDGAKPPATDKPYELDQVGCRFVPHVLVVPKGAEVHFLNSDATSHNVRLATFANDPLNQTVPAGRKHVYKTTEPETIGVKCDMHTWMSAHVVVTDATHWAVTDENGAFRIEGLPAGEHTVKVWHETLGKKEGKATVAADGSATLDLTLTKKKSKRSRRRRK